MSHSFFRGTDALNVILQNAAELLLQHHLRMLRELRRNMAVLCSEVMSLQLA
jgi:hypothetical protein